MQQRRFDAVVFDKDGTLLDIDPTWSPAIASAIDDATADQPTRLALAKVMGFDLDNQQVLPNAAIMTLNNAQIAELGQPLVDGWSFISAVADHVVDTLVPMAEAESTIRALRDLGLLLALVTNDAEQSTREQLERLGWDRDFDVVYGYDSGHGCKPDPGVVTAALGALDVSPRNAMMVGDSAADLIAARDAGVTPVLIGESVSHNHLATWCIESLSEVLELL